MTTELLEQTRLAFDYETLDTETRIVVQQRTGEIRERLRRTAQDIVEVGQRMVEVRDRLPHGQFGPWLSAEFGMSEGHARKMMQVARAFAGQNDHYDRFAPTALYLLAAPNTPEEARAEALERAEAGAPVSAKAAEELVAKHKPAPAPAPRAQRPAPPPERREAEEMDEEPLSPYEAQLAAQQAAVAPLVPPAPPPAPAPAPAEVIAELPAIPAPAATPPPLLVPLPTTTAANPAPLRTAAALVALLDQALNLATLDLAQLQHEAGPDAPIYAIPDAAVEQAARLFYASPALRGAAGFLAMSAKEQAA